MKPSPPDRPTGRSHRRGSARYPITLAATLAPIEPTDDNPQARGVVVRDLSRGGALLETDRHIDAGSIWLLRFTAPDGRAHEAHCLIRWRSVTESGAWRAGAQFIVDGSLLRAAGVSADAGARASELCDISTRQPWAQVHNVVAQGDLSVASLEGGAISVARDLSVRYSITDCVLDVGGSLVAPEALLAGGTAHVLRRASLGEIGGADGRPTNLILGRTAHTQSILTALKPALAAIDKETAHIDRVVAALKAKTSDQLTATDRESITALHCKALALREQRARMEGNTQRLRDHEQQRAEIRLQVARVIHPGVTLRAADAVATLTAELRGPLTITLDAEGRFAVKDQAEMPVDASEAMKAA
jgi:hypothetical protein